MIVKTEEFDRKFKEDINVVSLSKYKKVGIRGSYKDKPFSSYITDIDLVLYVSYDSDKFLKSLRKFIGRIKSSTEWIFLYIHPGIPEKFAVPWSVEDDSSCIYDRDKAIAWYNKIKHILSPEDTKFIQEKLFGDYVSLNDIIQAYGRVYANYSIRWKIPDILNGYIWFDNYKYNLVDMAKNRELVIKMVYHPNEDTYIPVDYTLVDPKYKVETMQSNTIRRYYMKEWYNVLKYYRRYLPTTGKIREEYNNIMKSIEYPISLYFQLAMLNSLQQISYSPSIIAKIYNKLKIPLSDYVILDNITGHKNALMNIVDNALVDFVRYFGNHVAPEYRKNIALYLNRSVEANIPISQKMIQERINQGIPCPFLVTDVDEFKKMTDVATRIQINIDKLIHCFIVACMNNHVDIHDFMEITGNNKLALKIMGDTIILEDNGRQIGTFNSVYLQKLQQYILLKKS